MEPSRVTDLKTEIVNVLDNVAPEVKYALLRHLIGEFPQWGLPQLDWVEEEGVFVCPHCVREIGVPEFWEMGHAIDDNSAVDEDTSNHILVEGGGLDDDAKGLFICPSCKLPVALPNGWSWEWM